MQKVNIIGAGLAGSEACYQLIKRNIPVRLYEMRPTKMTCAHHSSHFSELVCSNSLRSNDVCSGVGLLKEEMRQLDSLIIKMADQNQVPAGNALAVDRDQFSLSITNYLKNHPLVEVIEEEVLEIPDGPTIIATGPLTSDVFAKAIQNHFNEEYLYFYDAAAPIVEKESIDFTKAYYKSRYDKGNGNDYINCPMNKEQYQHFYQELISAQCTPLKEFEKAIFFEGCMPVEEMARRGEKTLLFGPLKPVGLAVEGKEKPYAVVQLRQDNAIASLYNIVGFQTHLLWKEQKRVLQLIPGLENCEIVRYGVMHRNSYLNAPRCLKTTYQSVHREDLFFAGQLSGVEGYVESAASGLLAGINMAKLLEEKPLLTLDNNTMIGSMAYYITHASQSHFQPMNANFGIMNLQKAVRKNERKKAYVEQSLTIIQELKKEYEL